MSSFLLRRLAGIIPTALALVFVVSLMLEIIPGDPVQLMMSETATASMKAAVRAQLGLNRPFLQRYVDYVFNALHGDLGRSFLQNVPVSSLVAGAFPATAELAAGAIVIMVLLGLPLGVISALKPNSVFDAFAQALSLVGISMPAFWIGLLLIYAFAFTLPVFPLGGRTGFLSLILPAFSLSLSSVGFLVRIIRANMLETMEQDYILTARSKGARESSVIVRHAFRNAALPVLTVLGLQFGALLGGAVVTEVVFSWPGMGRLIVNAILQRDYPVVQGAVLIFGLIFMALNVVTDMSYAILNPTIRYE